MFSYVIWAKWPGQAELDEARLGWASAGRASLALGWASSGRARQLGRDTPAGRVSAAAWRGSIWLGPARRSPSTAWRPLGSEGVWELGLAKLEVFGAATSVKFGTSREQRSPGSSVYMESRRNTLENYNKT